jgi:hypothetical protein
MTIPDELWFDLVVFVSAARYAGQDGLSALTGDATELLQRMLKVVETRDYIRSL